MRQEMTVFWDAVESAGSYANNLHLTPGRQPHQHLTTQFLQAGFLMPNQHASGHVQQLLCGPNVNNEGKNNYTICNNYM